MVLGNKWVKWAIMQAGIIISLQIVFKLFFPTDDQVLDRGFLRIQTISQQPSTLFRIGSIQDTIQGTLQQSLTSKAISTSAFASGFMLGSLDNSMKAAGEFILVNGHGFVHNADPKCSYYMTVQQADTIYTGSAVFISKDAAPSFALDGYVKRKMSDASPSLNQFLDAHFNSTNGKPFCYHGIVLFEKLQGVSNIKAPIYGENLIEKANEYLTEKIEKRDVYTAISGCAAKVEGRDEEWSNVFYTNPRDIATETFTTHSHALVLKEPVYEYTDATVLEAADRVFHVLGATSIVSWVRINTFVIAGMQQLHQ